MQSLEELMELAENREKLITTINSVKAYTHVVHRCGYRRIGIQVLDYGTEAFAYTSFNDPAGQITRVEKGLHQPDIVASVEEQVLTEIIDRAEEIQKHPITAALHYARQFTIRPRRAYLKIMRALTV
ncbi:hypothetical protein HY495_01465 [Candidatus Woesearchaeota archaeon]|nr:hypothetical protein [Candidatus Woesearchaeota archaeon]